MGQTGKDGQRRYTLLCMEMNYSCRRKLGLSSNSAGESPDSHVFTKLMSVCVCTQVKYRMGATNYANKDCGHNSTDDTDFKEEPK